MAVPNTSTFSMQDVADELWVGDLVAAFATANDGYFDPRYKGSKNSLYNFRNFGWRGILVHRDSMTDIFYENSDIYPWVMHGSNESTSAGSHFFAGSTYLAAFFIDPVLKNIEKYPSSSEYSPDGTIYSIYCHSLSKIFVVADEPNNNTCTLYSMTFNTSTGAFSVNDTYVYAYNSWNINSRISKVVSNDSGDVIFCTTIPYNASFHSTATPRNFIRTIELNVLDQFDPLTGTTYDTGGEVHALKWANGYLVASIKIGTTNYLRTYSYTFGNLSLESSITVSSTYDTVTKIETDGNGLLFCSHIGGSTYITSWRIADDGSISFKDADVNGGAPLGIAHSKISGVTISGDYTNIYALRTNSLDDYLLEDTKAEAGDIMMYAGFSPYRYVVVYTNFTGDAGVPAFHLYEIL